MEHSFELDLTWGTKIRELDLIKMKKQTLDQLLASEKISQSTYEFLDKKLTEETIDLEAQIKSLSDSMTARAKELERKVGQLEISLANLEMHHATGEIDNRIYGTHNKTILLGLEAAKQELKNVKNSLLNTLSEAVGTIEAPQKLETITVESVEMKETGEREILETKEAECKSINESLESAEPNQELTAKSTANETAQCEVPSLEDSSEEIHESSTEAETST